MTNRIIAEETVKFASLFGLFVLLNLCMGASSLWLIPSALFSAVVVIVPAIHQSAIRQREE